MVRKPVRGYANNYLYIPQKSDSHKWYLILIQDTVSLIFLQMSILSTQLSTTFYSRPVSADCLNAKNQNPLSKQSQLPEPPLFSALFRYSISLPLTSEQPSPHVILRLLPNISIALKIFIFKGFYKYPILSTLYL